MDERKYGNLCYDEDDESEISLLDILLILAEGKKIILSFFLIFLIAGLTYVTFTKKTEYESTMEIAAFTQENSQAGDFNIFASGKLISAILTSDAVLNLVIDQNDLLKDEEGGSQTQIAAINKLKGAINIKANSTTGILTVSVKNISPEKTFNITKSLYDSLLTVLQQIGMSILGQKDVDMQSEIKKNNSSSMVVQLVLLPTLPVQPLPQGRKLAVLSGLLGLFVGLTFVFIKHFWQVSASDPETEEKVKKLKKLLGISEKSAN